MDKNNSKNEKNMPNTPNQMQPINDLSRFGHSVTLCKEEIINNINYLYSKF